MTSLGDDLLVTVNKLQDLVFNTIGNDSLDLPQIVRLPEQYTGTTAEVPVLAQAKTLVESLFTIIWSIEGKEYWLTWYLSWVTFCCIGSRRLAIVRKIFSA